jgi:choline kinase
MSKAQQANGVVTSIIATPDDYVGVILAAGVGSRLRPMTNNLPKCLVKTAGKPILEYQIDAYRYAGVKDLIIVVGYEGSAVKNYCKSIKDIKVTIIENFDYENTNNMYSFYLARSAIGQRPYILNNADLAIDQSIIDVMLKAEAQSAVAVDTSVYLEESMKIVLRGSGYISGISKIITKDQSNGCSIDFYKFSLEDGQHFINTVASIIEVEKNLKDWTEVALHRAFQAQQLNFKIIDVAGFDWVEIDGYDDLATSDRKFSGFDSTMNQIETVFLDLDGTVYVGDDIVSGACEAIFRMREKGINVYFLSNNSSKSKTDYVKKLALMGIPVVEEEIILSSDAVLSYLLSKQVQTVHVLGTESLKKIFLEAGFLIDTLDPEFVVIGYDT